MFKRNLEKLLIDTSKSFPIIGLIGPRQSGKTTLLRTLFPEYQYYSLENPDTLLNFKTDPRSFINDNKKTAIIFDEAQNAPELFSYLQGMVDNPNSKTKYILSGSQNFLLSEKISQTLAGRIAILELMTLTHDEFRTHENMPIPTLFEYLYKGTYPRIYQENLESKIWYSSYIKTYIERDIRQLINVQDLSQFQLFIKMCAGRHGQELNLLSLGSDCGISQTTAERWLSALETSYILFRLQPYYKNFNKRLIKRPKLYFYDSGLVCFLLGIESADHLSTHAQRGAIFEGYVISELQKLNTYKLQKPAIYFWRDQSRIEVDCIIDKPEVITGVEIKSSQTIVPDHFKTLQAWSKITQGNKILVYAGEEEKTINSIPCVPWNKISEI